MKNFWAGRRALVTGATGIVGSWLTKELLEQGTHVTALVLDADPKSELLRSGTFQRISVVNGKLEDLTVLERAICQYEIDTVFHLGAQTLVGIAHRSPLATFESNIRGTYHVLEACRTHLDQVKRVIIASSDKAYGGQSRLPYTEEMTLNGRHPYEASKSCADILAQTYAVTYGLPIAIARCGNIYGGGDLNWSRVVPGTIRSFLNRESPIIRSDGMFVRDYFYVKDAARAYLRLAEALTDKKFHGEAFNFSSEKPMTVLEVVQTIQDLMDCAHIQPDIRNHAKGEILNQHLSAAKAHDLLNWTPDYDLETGLRETIQWYQEALEEESSLSA